METMVLILSLTNNFSVHFLEKSPEGRQNASLENLGVLLESKEKDMHLRNIEHIIECQVLADRLTKSNKCILSFLFNNILQKIWVDNP